MGSNRGTLVFYKWGEFGLHTDELPSPKKTAINCLIPISENIVLTGREDGQIRSVLNKNTVCFQITVNRVFKL